MQNTILNIISEHMALAILVVLIFYLVVYLYQKKMINTINQETLEAIEESRKGKLTKTKISEL